ncbi:Class I SAM-dependent methyltransferase OS=Streptomyces tendae OX=1932 GN=GUR47_06510 PE=4 SV=1 [Streptomyces tendae]
MEHARTFVAGAVERLGLGPDAFVVEVASNDGYLLRHMVDRGIRCLGIEPSVNVGAAAREAGVPTLTEFLSPETGAGVRAEHGPADLVVANNVYAHIPDVVGFTRGLRALVADDGWVSVEVQHLLTLIEENQYDTIYHEHFQYYTVASAIRALASGGLTLVDVELLPTHGGSHPAVGPARRGGR